MQQLCVIKHTLQSSTCNYFYFLIQDGQLQVGDRIISINEEMFTDVTREDAKTLLNKFKIRFSALK